MVQLNLQSVWDSLSGAVGRRLVVGGLLATHLFLGVASTLDKCTTYDEIAHITAGYAYWRFNDYRLQPENGNIPQRIAALPLVLSGKYRFPSLDQEAWHRSNVWELGRQFFYECGNDLETLLLLARSAVAMLSVLLCLVVYLWSKQLFGTMGGIVSLCLCVFSPTLLAHGRLATSDVCNALFTTLSLWAVWSLLHRVSVGRVFLGGLAVAGLFLSKMSAVLFLPLAAILALVTLARRQSLVLQLPGIEQQLIRATWRRTLIVSLVVSVITLECLIVVWAAYGWRYSAFGAVSSGTTFHHYKTVENAAAHGGHPGHVVVFCDRHRLLPQAYLYGFSYVAAEKDRGAFLNGEYSDTGWPQYFPYCLMVKTPIPTLILVALALGMLLRTSPRPESGCCPEVGSCPGANGTVDSLLKYQSRPLILWLAFIWPIFICSTLNIGHRHILPTYPAMFILAGAVGVFRANSAARKAVIFGLLAWLVFESVVNYPHYLAYFNQFVDRDRAHEHLVDSNLDWGQDLPGLKSWLDRRGGQDAIYLAYFGMGSPAHYGIQYRRIPPRDTATVEPYAPGVYCISATWLEAVYFRVRGRWNSLYESEYQESLSAVRPLLALDQNRMHTEIVDRELSDAVWKYNLLRTGRLLAYLRRRNPDAHVGHSILIYELTKTDLREALEGSPPEMDENSH